MADVGDEFRFEPRRFQGGVVGGLELLLRGLALGDVADDGLGDDASVQTHGMEGDFRREQGAVGPLPLPVEIAVAFVHGQGDLALGQFGGGQAVGLEFRAQVVGGGGDELLPGGKAEHPHRRRVDVDEALAVQQHDAVGVGVEQGLVLELFLLHFQRLAGGAADDQGGDHDAQARRHHPHENHQETGVGVGHRGFFRRQPGGLDLDVQKVVELLDQGLLHRDGVVLQHVQRLPLLAAHGQLDGAEHVGLGHRRLVADVLQHHPLVVGEGHLLQFLPSAEIGVAVFVEAQQFLFLFERVGEHHNGVHADGPVAQGIPHGAGEFGLDVVLVDDAFQVAVEGRHLVQAGQGQAHHQQKGNGKAGGDAELDVFGEHGRRGRRRAPMLPVFAGRGYGWKAGNGAESAAPVSQCRSWARLARTPVGTSHSAR
jgi:hypothetical protein